MSREPSPNSDTVEGEMRQPVALGVAGGTGSGKTTVARALLESVGPDRISFLAQDAYYRDIDWENREQLAAHNFDHPNALELLLRTGTTEGPDGRTQYRAFNVDNTYLSTHLSNLTSDALSAFYVASRQLSAYIGWSQEAFESWATEYRAVLPGSFEPEAETSPG